MRLRNPVALIRQRRLRLDLAPQIDAVERYLVGREPTGPPVLFFNASTRIYTLSLNAAFSLLAAWAVRAGGHPALHLVCHAALSPCVLGTDRAAPRAAPPCGPCQALSRVLVPPERTLAMSGDPARVGTLRAELERRPLADMMGWEYSGLPLGALVVPSVRWILRRHRLTDDDRVRTIFAGYLASAAVWVDELRATLSARRPRALVAFNGVFYPEALARRVALDLDVPVVTHEVGLTPNSAFFSHGEATFREVDLPQDLHLTAPEEAELDAVLARRVRGEFTMAGIRFWPEIAGLPAQVTQRREGFAQVVSVFTNVVFDTSQVHANILFDDMFDWLDRLADVMRAERGTLFVIRAHPDETRRGKESQESVAAWVGRAGIDRLENVVFIGPDEPASSYDLIHTSKFVLVYNSSIGLEASLLGTPALCAGRARFTRSGAVTTPEGPQAYWMRLREFLDASSLSVPSEQRRAARAFLHTELFRASLDLSEFIQPDAKQPGMVRLSPFAPDRITTAPVMDVLRGGILEGRPFLAGDGALGARGGIGVEVADPIERLRGVR